MSKNINKKMIELCKIKYNINTEIIIKNNLLKFQNIIGGLLKSSQGIPIFP